MATWIGDEFSQYQVGQVGFLVDRTNLVHGWRGTYLPEHPAHTTQTNQPCLLGWCGTDHDDVEMYACGVCRVVKTAKNGRALVVRLTGAELSAALETLGYPELDPAPLATAEVAQRPSSSGE